MYSKSVKRRLASAALVLAMVFAMIPLPAAYGGLSAAAADAPAPFESTIFTPGGNVNRVNGMTLTATAVNADARSITVRLTGITDTAATGLAAGGTGEYLIYARIGTDIVLTGQGAPTQPTTAQAQGAATVNAELTTDAGARISNHHRFTADVGDVQDRELTLTFPAAVPLNVFDAGDVRIFIGMQSRRFHVAGAWGDLAGATPLARFHELNLFNMNGVTLHGSYQRGAQITAGFNYTMTGIANRTGTYRAFFSNDILGGPAMPLLAGEEANPQPGNAHPANHQQIPIWFNPIEPQNIIRYHFMAQSHAVGSGGYISSGTTAHHGRPSMAVLRVEFWEDPTLGSQTVEGVTASASGIHNTVGEESYTVSFELHGSAARAGNFRLSIDPDSLPAGALLPAGYYEVFGLAQGADSGRRVQLRITGAVGDPAALAAGLVWHFDFFPETAFHYASSIGVAVTANVRHNYFANMVMVTVPHDAVTGASNAATGYTVTLFRNGGSYGARTFMPGQATPLVWPIENIAELTDLAAPFGLSMTVARNDLDAVPINITLSPAAASGEPLISAAGSVEGTVGRNATATINISTAPAGLPRGGVLTIGLTGTAAADAVARIALPVGADGLNGPFSFTLGASNALAALPGWGIYLSFQPDFSQVIPLASHSGVSAGGTDGAYNILSSPVGSGRASVTLRVRGETAANGVLRVGLAGTPAAAAIAPVELPPVRAGVPLDTTLNFSFPVAAGDDLAGVTIALDFQSDYERPLGSVDAVLAGTSHTIGVSASAPLMLGAEQAGLRRTVGSNFATARIRLDGVPAPTPDAPNATGALYLRLVHSSPSYNTASPATGTPAGSFLPGAEIELPARAGMSAARTVTLFVDVPDSVMAQGEPAVAAWLDGISIALPFAPQEVTEDEYIDDYLHRYALLARGRIARTGEYTATVFVDLTSPAIQRSGHFIIGFNDGHGGDPAGISFDGGRSSEARFYSEGREVRDVLTFGITFTDWDDVRGVYFDMGFVPDGAFIYMLDYYDESLVFGGDVANGADVAFVFVRANMVPYQNAFESDDAFAARMARPVRPFDAARGRWAGTMSGRVNISRHIPRRNPGLSNWVALRWIGSVIESDIRAFESLSGASVNRDTMQITNFAFDPAAAASATALIESGDARVLPGSNGRLVEVFPAAGAPARTIDLFGRDFIEVRPRPNPAAALPAGRTPMNPRELPSVADQLARITGGVPNPDAFFISLRAMGRVFYDINDQVFRNRSDETIEAFFATDRGVSLTASRLNGLNPRVFMSQLRPMQEVAFGPDRMPSGVQGMFRIASAEFAPTKLYGSSIVALHPAELTANWASSGFPSLPVRFRVGAPGRAPQTSRISIPSPRNAAAPITIRGLGPAVGVVLHSQNENINGNFRTNVTWHNGAAALLPVAPARATEAQRPFANELANNMTVEAFDAVIMRGIASMTDLTAPLPPYIGVIDVDGVPTASVTDIPLARATHFFQNTRLDQDGNTIREFVFTIRALPVPGRRLMSPPALLRFPEGLYLQGVREAPRQLTAADAQRAVQDAFANNSPFRSAENMALLSSLDEAGIRAAIMAAALAARTAAPANAPLSANIQLSWAVTAGDSPVPVGTVTPATTAAAGRTNGLLIRVTDANSNTSVNARVPNLAIPRNDDPVEGARAALLARAAELAPVAEGVTASPDGDGLAPGALWATQAAIDAFQAAIAAAMGAADAPGRDQPSLAAALASLNSAADSFALAIAEA